MAEALTGLRPAITAWRFDGYAAEVATRHVSQIVTSNAGLAAIVRSCRALSDVGDQVDALVLQADKALDKAQGAPNARGQRKATAKLFALLPAVFALSRDAIAAAETLSIAIAPVTIPDEAGDPLGSLPPLTVDNDATPPPSTPRPTTGDSARSTGWTKSTYDTALGWAADVRTSYAATAGLWAVLDFGGCGPRSTRDECAAAGRAVATELKPIDSALSAHLDWMRAHPPAECFKDAYSADRKVATLYMDWIARWDALGEWTREGATNGADLRDADSAEVSFRSAINGFFSDCA